MKKNMKKILLLTLVLTSKLGFSQLYFPPLAGNIWQTTTPESLGWCTDRIDSLYQVLETNKTKAFIVLKDGKIVLEKYFGTFTQDSIWYWASAGKTVTAFLTGVAQQQGLLNINDSTSKYLGKGWTSASPEKEGLIKIKHQLTMTTGLDYNVLDTDCKLPSCLKYKADAGSFWYYHNATYLLLQDVLEKASNQTYQQYTNQQLNLKTGMAAGWLDGVLYSKPRSMARFGLLMLNKGVWAGDSLLKDMNYYQQMMNTSQQHNLSYGYLWWLNGKASYKLPGSTFNFNGKLCPTAPDDLVSGLGKNDQKLYLWPSRNIVVIRMGDAAADNSPVPVVFDIALWDALSKVMCSEYTGLGKEEIDNQMVLWPNPTHGKVSINLQNAVWIGQLNIISLQGQTMMHIDVNETSNQLLINTELLAPGLYTLQLNTASGNLYKKIMVE